AGSLSGVGVGAKFRLYNPLEINNPKLPCLEITQVTPFYSKAVTRGPFKFKVGDLVVQENYFPAMELLAIFFMIEMPFNSFANELYLLMPRVENIIRLNRFKKLVSSSSFDINLSITLWMPPKEPIKNGDIYLEIPGSREFFKKQAVFNPAEIEEKQVLSAGSLLTFQVKNNSQRDCYIYLIEIMENGTAEAVFPQPGDRRQSAWLAAGAELDLKNNVLLLLDKPGKETIKLIAAEAPLNIAFLAQEAPRMEGRGLTQKWGTVQFSIIIDK
ncbi:MAG: DUF4384 domain-containing protein, partial [Acidobacteria bacterium]|nr:DUF4384 domain-containing protein [Acidobacteriota bacterium]